MISASERPQEVHSNQANADGKEFQEGLLKSGSDLNRIRTHTVLCEHQAYFLLKSLAALVPPKVQSAHNRISLDIV